MHNLESEFTSQVYKLLIKIAHRTYYGSPEWEDYKTLGQYLTITNHCLHVRNLVESKEVSEYKSEKLVQHFLSKGILINQEDHLREIVYEMGRADLTEVADIRIRIVNQLLPA